MVAALFVSAALHAAPISRFVDPYYPDEPRSQLKLNYYYDRTGRWVKFSDWIPYRRRMTEPVFFEDFYQIYSLAPHYGVQEVQESIYYLTMALSARFRHPGRALCAIKTEAEYAKYRHLMFMQTNLLIMRMFLRLGSLYDKRHLYFHDFDVADDLSVSFKVARAYYEQARPFWEAAQKHALGASEYPFELDLPGLESERFRIAGKKTDFGRIIDTHIARVDAKSKAVEAFLAQEGSPRPVKQRMQNDIADFYKEGPASPLEPPALNAPDEELK